jgi:hypothetical protein
LGKLPSAPVYHSLKREYGVAYEGGISFADNPDRVLDFRVQPHEGFEYVYDLGDNWELAEKV